MSPLNSYKIRFNRKKVILDLSFPEGQSVNAFISKEFYLGKRI
jgi:hypothetical protein